ncbi:MAG: hypothetical protein ACU0CO_18875, partial [Shimia sp.]
MDGSHESRPTGAPAPIAVLVPEGASVAIVGALLDPAAAEGVPVDLYGAREGAVRCRGAAALWCRDVDAARGRPDVLIAVQGSRAEALAAAPFAKHLRYWARQSVALGAVGAALDDLAALGLTKGGVAAPDMAGPSAVAHAAAPAQAHALGLWALERVVDGAAARRAAEAWHAPVGGTGPKGRPAPLRAALAAMEGALAAPLPIPAIAQAAGVSQRQLERLCNAH